MYFNRSPRDHDIYESILYSSLRVNRTGSLGGMRIGSLRIHPYLWGYCVYMQHEGIEMHLCFCSPGSPAFGLVRPAEEVKQQSRSLCQTPTFFLISDDYRHTGVTWSSIITKYNITLGDTIGNTCVGKLSVINFSAILASMVIHGSHAHSWAHPFLRWKICIAVPLDFLKLTWCAIGATSFLIPWAKIRVFVVEQPIMNA